METTKWTIDNMHSEIGFKVKHMMITNVSGNFGQFAGNIETEGTDFSKGTFAFSADINSINTGVADRDGHLKSDDFFNAEMYPQLSFKSTGVKRLSDGELVIEGDMTIRDVTKPIVLSAELSDIVVDPYGQTKVGMSINERVKRSEYGLKWNAVTEAGSIVVSDEIKLNCEIQFVKQA
jgi:polyisoprenoid-binding protein YceI